MSDMKANCTGEGGSVLGIDRTFNLGKCFVTAISYKNKKVIHQKNPSKSNNVRAFISTLGW